MANEIDISQLASEVGSVLSMYATNVQEETEKWLEKTSKQTVKRIKAKCPNNAPSRYKSGWRAKKVSGEWVVYQANMPGLAHLMEKSHAVISHGKKVSDSTPTPHIKPAEEEIQKDVNDLIKKLQK